MVRHRSDSADIDNSPRGDLRAQSGIVEDTCKERVSRHGLIQRVRGLHRGRGWRFCGSRVVDRPNFSPYVWISYGFISLLPISVLIADRQLFAKNPEISAVSPTAESAHDGLLP